jgi:WXG100 family type VII secretion target
MANGADSSKSIIQINYEELASIAQNFEARAEASQGMIQTVRYRAGALRDSGWTGLGADAFLSEMDQRVFPALDRLTQAFTEAGRVTQQVADHLHQAEEEAARLFQGEGSGGNGSGGGGGAGGGDNDSPKTEPARVVPSVVDEKVNTPKTNYTIEGPTEQKDYAFKGKTADANVYTVKFDDGTTLKIVAPKDATTGFHNHTVNEAAEAAAHLTTANRKVINTVMLNPITNPADPDWAVKYNDPNFHSYMTAGKAGVVTIYPNPDGKPMPNQNYMWGTMIHETGHTWSYKTWGDDKTAGEWANWKKAMDADKAVPSKYAQNSISEDVAESIQAYVSTKGTPKFEEYRKLFPERWKMLDAQFK